ncbi:hypothetical protein K457DRAFT_23473 [Linnemannia elongata AG-77]|uniref:CBM1 domain-containing protein n=1 Tax=Linnemannia elongata AG-77 TaxID=1314771 RepID=A0A197JL48_9FUNG|nr:hypothetical protein K457DRAFT_23473 [Linnemannia elongata AG-77]
MLAIVITLAVSLSTLPAIQTEPACYYVSDSVGLGCGLCTVIMARLSFLFAVLIAVAALTSSVSALPVEETVAPVEPADMPSSGAYCVCNMHGWSAHCGMCTSDETYRGCHNEWNSYCS